MIKTIGVIGAGQMGNGIAHVCALAGYDVTLVDVEPAAARQGAWRRSTSNMEPPGRRAA